jgi:hypothetical protein
MTTTTAQNAELAKPVTRTVYFVEFQFASSTSRLSTANFPITWGGFDWSGVGSIGSIGAIEESDGLESRPLNFTINAAQPSWIALAVGDVAAYRGRPAKMYMCPLDESFQMIDTPVQCWSGTMDMVSVGVNGDESSITLKCETSAYGLKRRPSLRLNDAQQRKEHPTDTGLSYLTALISDPGVWLSVRFQQK